MSEQRTKVDKLDRDLAAWLTARADAIRDVAAYRASPPEYPGMALVPVSRLSRLAEYVGLPESLPTPTLRCAKCGEIDIGTTWHQDTYAGRGMKTCSFVQQYASGTFGEHLHHNCRNCSFEWRAATLGVTP